METLIIYDSTGSLVMPCTGSFVTPQGELHYLVVTIPQGKNPIRVDVTDLENCKVIFEDLPTSMDEQLEKRG